MLSDVDRPLREVEVVGVGPRGHWSLVVAESRTARRCSLDAAGTGSVRNHAVAA